MKNISKKLGIAALALPLMLASAATYATGTFATFTDLTSGKFVFTNNGASTTFAATNDAVSFQYIVGGLDAALTGSQLAHLTYSSSASTAALSGFGLDIQRMNSTTISIVRDTAYNGHTNLLSVTFSGTLANPLYLFGANAGSALSELASTGSGQTVTFTSDFLNFSNTSSRDVGLAFTSVAPPVGIDANGLLKSFTASATGSFSADPTPLVVSAVPEADTYAMLLAGLGVIGFLARRRQSKAA